MRKAKLIAILFFIGFVVAHVLGAADKPASSTSPPAATAEGWQKEFEEICSKTQDAMTFSPEQLQVLVQRCDALEPKIEKLDDTRKKVFLRRLKQCRGLFAYVLDSKQKDKK